MSKDTIDNVDLLLSEVYEVIMGMYHVVMYKCIL